MKSKSGKWNNSVQDWKEKELEECETGTRNRRCRHEGRSGDERWGCSSVIEEQWREQKGKEEKEEAVE